MKHRRRRPFAVCRIHVLHTSIPTHTHTHIAYWMETLRDYDISRTNYVSFYDLN